MDLKVLFDTNEIIDCVLERNDNHLRAKKLFELVIKRHMKGFVTGHSLTDFFYIVRKDINLELRKKILLMIVNNFTILTEPKDAFLNVLSDQDFFDLEDGLQMRCAEDAILDFIITENIKDFTNSTVKAISAEDFLKAL